MKRLAWPLVIAVLSVMAFVSNSQNASAQGGVYVSQLASDAATDVVNGRIVSSNSVVLDGAPYHVSEIEISGTEKGQLSGSILVETPGGDLPDGTVVVVSHTPELIPGELVQLALAPAEGLAGLAVAVGRDLEVYGVVGGIDGAYGLLPDGVGRAAATGDYTLTGSFWPNFAPPVAFFVNPAGSGLDQAATIAGTRQAFEVWQDDLGSDVYFTYGGTTGSSGVNLGDRQNTISWVDQPAGSGWLAQASWITTGDGGILEFDVRVSRGFSWSNGAASGKYDIGTVVGHEVGHGIGLGHAPASSELMYYQIVSGSAMGLGPGDRSGLRALYESEIQLCAGEEITYDMNTGFGGPTAGDDVILGTPGDDVIDAGDGDDLICAGAGNDVVKGGSGNDTIEGGGGDDKLFGQSGDDRILGGNGNDIIHGNRGNDALSGEAGNDKIYGYAGDDWIWGGPGRDVLHGNRGNDRLFGGTENDKLFGYSENDELDGGDGDDLLVGNFGDDWLEGGDGADILIGSDGADVLNGGASNDELNGNSGDDQLNGGPGNDHLDGGIDSDDCNGASGSDTATRCEGIVNVP